jgi:signal transduction histidine kinase
MIRQLKKRVVFSAMISCTMVLLLIIGVINVVNYHSIVKDSDEILKILNDNNGDFPEDLTSDGLHTQIDGILGSPEAPYETRFFTMIYNGNGFESVDTEHISAVNDEKAVSLGEQVIGLKKQSGFTYLLNGVYRYYKGTSDGVMRITFLDCTRTMQNYYTFFALSIAISMASLLAICIMMIIFATQIISPIAESYEKQKQFITDAGHDIKTPITIIDADREILEMDIGENEWLDDIKRQTKRLTKLTNDLIYLSRMEEGTDLKELSSFSISTICHEEADSFSAVAMKRGLEIVTDIEDEIDINGSEEDVRRLLSILFDNAIKYAKENSTIGIKTTKHGRYVTVTISNVAENMTEEQTKRMFDRFYRADSSRATSGGFGIGLAMAQAIVTSHNGKIYAELGDDKVLRISASFPTQYGSFRLITNFVEKQPKNVNNSSQNDNHSAPISKTPVENDIAKNNNAPILDDEIAEKIPEESIAPDEPFDSVLEEEHEELFPEELSDCIPEEGEEFFPEEPEDSDSEKA